MKNVSGWKLGIGLLAVCMAGGAGAQTAWVSPDKSVALTLPTGWHTETKYGKFALVAPDGSRYAIRQDAAYPLPKGDPGTSAEFRRAASGLAVPVVGAADFVDAQTVAIRNGSGGGFRFRSKGPKPETTSVWLAVVGEHSLALVPEKVDSGDEAPALKNILESVTLAEPQETPAPARTGQKAAGKQRGKKRGGAQNITASGATNSGNASAPGGASTRSVGGANTAGLFEMYTGRLRAGDGGLTLNLQRDGHALLTWTPASGNAVQFAGTYTGVNGNYAVSLNRTAGTAPDNVQTLNLNLSSQGSSEVGTYTTDVATYKRPIDFIEFREFTGTGSLQSRYTSVAPGTRLAGQRAANRRAVRRANIGRYNNGLLRTRAYRPIRVKRSRTPRVITPTIIVR